MDYTKVVDEGMGEEDDLTDERRREKQVASIRPV